MSKIASLVEKLYGVKAEIMAVEQALVTLAIAFGLWSPTDEQYVALGVVQTAILALLVAWYRPSVRKAVK